ncbi:hypothetical protein LINPERPRIM_LOCUS39955 [Linum perenne]
MSIFRSDQVCLLMIYAALVICLVFFPLVAEPARTSFLPISGNSKKRVLWGFGVVSKIDVGRHPSDPDNHGHHH